MKPQIYTDTHRFLNQEKEDIKINSSVLSPEFISVHLCKSVAKNFFSFSCPFVLVRG